MRAIDRLLSLVLGLALAAAGALAAVEAVQLHRGEPSVLVPRSTWDAELGALRWDDPTLRSVAFALVSAGAVLILLQLVPRRTLRLPMRSEPNRPTWIGRTAVDRLVADAARRDPEVLDAEASSGRRRVDVTVTTARSADATAVRHRLVADLEGRVAELDLLRPLTVSVKVDPGKDRVR